MKNKYEEEELLQINKEYEEAEIQELKRQAQEFKIWQVWKYPWWVLVLWMVIAMAIRFGFVLTR